MEPTLRSSSCACIRSGGFPLAAGVLAAAYCRLHSAGLTLPPAETESSLATPRTTVISVYRCSDYIQAQLLAGLLREHNIDVYLQGALLQGALGELPAMGHLSIMVDNADRVAAQRIIAAYERGDLELDEQDAE